MISRRLYALASPFVMRLQISQRFLSQDVIRPEETEDVIPPWISSSSLDTISGVQPWGNLERELKKIKIREATHAPIVRFSYGPGIVGPTGIATKKFGRRISHSFTHEALTQKVLKRKTVTYINDATKNRFFGHWLLDGVSQAGLVQDASYYLTNLQGSLHCEEYRSSIGLRNNDSDYISADEVVVYSDHSQGSSKRNRYTSIKDKLSELFESRLSSDKVFLWRGSTGKARHFKNQHKVKERLRSDGWIILDVTEPLSKIFSVLSGASVVAGMEGSNLSHSHYCTRSGTIIIVLVPHDKFTAIQLDYVRAVGNYCGFCVMKGNDSTGYQLDFDALNRAVDQSFATFDSL